jgi:hypothetical protein
MPEMALLSRVKRSGRVWHRPSTAAGMAAVQMSRPAFPAAALWDGPVAHSFSEIDKMLEEGAL